MALIVKQKMLEYDQSKEDCSKDADILRRSNQYCRLCASHNVGEMIGIFSEADDNSRVAEKISRCLPIIVLSSDKLSLHICRSCLTKLNISYELINTALRTEVLLKKHVFNLENIQTSIDKQDDNSCTKRIIHNQHNISEESPDSFTKKIDCKILLEDDGSVRVRRLINNKYAEDENNSETYPHGEMSGDGSGDAELEYGENSVNPITVLPILNIEGPATCDLCDITFIDMEAFDQHISADHFVNYNLKCRLCDTGFEQSEDLLTHKILKHSDKLLVCEKCKNKPNKRKGERKSKRKGNLISNDMVARNSCNDSYMLHIKPELESDLTCKCGILHEDKSSCHHICEPQENMLSTSESPIKDRKNRYEIEESFSTQSVNYERDLENQPLKLHSKAFYEEIKIDSNISGGTMKGNTSAVVHHKRKLRKISSLKCITCNKVFTNEVFYRRHQYIHDPAYWDRFRCKVCHRPFRDAEALMNHSQLHSGIKPHMCDLCGRTYNRYSNMLKHQKLHKPLHQWEHICKHCGSKFEKLTDLIAHIKRSHASKSAKSERVSAKVTSKDIKWICSFCGKRLSSKLSLQDHERIHTGIKPFVCKWCGREFRSRPNLLQHHLTHTGDRKHSCEVCGKKFARKSFVVQHMRVHTGEKPFECNVCGHRFTQSGDMRRHRQRHFDSKTKAAYVVNIPSDDNTIFVKVRASS